MASRYWGSALYVHQPVQSQEFVRKSQEFAQNRTSSPTTHNRALVIPASAPRPSFFSRTQLTHPQTVLAVASMTSLAVAVCAIATPFSIMNAMVLWWLLGSVSLAWGSYTHHTGLIIMGSLVGSIGLATILAGIAAPFQSTTAQAGLFLLAVASGWFMMIVLSHRFTRSTQWWALIPGIMKMLTVLVITIS